MNIKHIDKIELDEDTTVLLKEIISYMYETESSHYQEFLDDGGQSSSHILGKVMSLETRIENIKSEKVLTT